MKAMEAHHYDIVRKENEKLLLIEEAVDLEGAKSRLRELASVWPGEFQLIDQQNHQVAAQNSDPPRTQVPKVGRNPGRH